MPVLVLCNSQLQMHSTNRTPLPLCKEEMFIVCWSLLPLYGRAAIEQKMSLLTEAVMSVWQIETDWGTYRLVALTLLGLGEKWDQLVGCHKMLSFILVCSHNGWIFAAWIQKLKRLGRLCESRGTRCIRESSYKAATFFVSFHNFFVMNGSVCSLENHPVGTGVLR